MESQSTTGNPTTDAGDKPFRGQSFTLGWDNVPPCPKNDFGVHRYGEKHRRFETLHYQECADCGLTLEIDTSD